MAALKCYEQLLNGYQEFFKLQDQNGEEMEVEIDNKPIKIPYTNIISAVMTAVESEKDPRNLLVSFELSRLVLKILSVDENSFKTIEPFVEEIFENIS